MPFFNRSRARVALGVVPPMLLLVWWQLQSAGSGAQALAFVPLPQVGSEFADLIASGLLLSDSLDTLARAVTGFLMGALAGVAAGMAMGVSPLFERFFGPLYHAVRQVPLLGWLPLIGLWLGNGEGAKLLIVGLAAFYPTVLNTYEGVINVEASHRELGRLYSFGPLQRFRFILLPGALPLILTGLSQAITFAWIATIGTEILLGAGGGLGATMSHAQAQQRMDTILVAILVTGILGFSINYLFALLRRHLLRWQVANV
ncbi:MAG: ABC transporter permease [Novosphingobium sp.]